MPRIGPNPDATVEEKTAYLRRDEETQNRLADLREAVTAARSGSDRNLADMRAALEQRLSSG